MFENKNFQSWFKENTPKEGLSETTTFSKQFVKDAWDNGYYVGYNKAKEEGKVVVEHFEAYGQCRDSRRIASLEAENEKLKERNIKFQKILTEDFIKDVSVSMEYADKLEQAKGLLTKVMRNTWSIDSNVVDEINEFLKARENE